MALRFLNKPRPFRKILDSVKRTADFFGKQQAETEKSLKERGKVFKKDQKKKPRVEKVKEAKEPAIKTTRAEAAEEKASKPERIIAGVLERPHITEKTSGAAKENKYVFIVRGGANKPEVKRAIGSRYGVDAVAVNILNMPGKERKRGKQIGWRPGFKKAIVTLKEGQSIEIQ